MYNCCFLPLSTWLKLIDVAHVCYVLLTQALGEKYQTTAEVLKETKEKLDVAMSNNNHASSLLQVSFPKLIIFCLLEKRLLSLRSYF